MSKTGLNLSNYKGICKKVEKEGFDSVFWDTYRSNMCENPKGKKGQSSGVSEKLKEIKKAGISNDTGGVIIDEGSGVDYAAAIKKFNELSKCISKAEKNIATYTFNLESKKFCEAYQKAIEGALPKFKAAVSSESGDVDKETKKIATEGFTGVFWKILAEKILKKNYIKNKAATTVKDNLLYLRGMNMGKDGSLSAVNAYSSQDMEEVIKLYESLETNIGELKKLPLMQSICSSYEKIIKKEIGPAKKKLEELKKDEEEAAKLELEEDSGSDSLSPEIEKQASKVEKSLKFILEKLKKAKQKSSELEGELDKKYSEIEVKEKTLKGNPKQAEEMKAFKTKLWPEIEKIWGGRTGFQTPYAAAKKEFKKINETDVGKELNGSIGATKKVTKAMNKVRSTRISKDFAKAEEIDYQLTSFFLKNRDKIKSLEASTK